MLKWVCPSCSRRALAIPLNGCEGCGTPAIISVSVQYNWNEYPTYSTTRYASYREPMSAQIDIQAVGTFEGSLNGIGALINRIYEDWL